MIAFSPGLTYHIDLVKARLRRNNVSIESNNLKPIRITLRHANREEALLMADWLLLCVSVWYWQ